MFVPVGTAELALLGVLGSESPEVGTEAVLLDEDDKLISVDGRTLEPGLPEVGTASVAVILVTEGRLEAVAEFESEEPGPVLAPGPEVGVASVVLDADGVEVPEKGPLLEPVLEVGTASVAVLLGIETSPLPLDGAPSEVGTASVLLRITGTLKSGSGVVDG